IAAAVALITRRIYHSLFTPPKNLRHIPNVSYLQQFLNRNPVLWTIYVADPILAKDVTFRPEFANKVNAIEASFGSNGSFEAFIGSDNVAAVNNPHWKNQRKIMNPAFHRSQPVGLFGNLMLEVFRSIDETQANGDHVIIIKVAQRLTLEALGRAVFGFKFNALNDENSIWVKTYNQFIEGFTDFTVFLPRINKILRWFDHKRREQYEAGFKLAELLDKMAAEKKQALLEKKTKKDGDDIPDSEKDLLTLMLEAEMNDKEGVSMTKKELRHNMGIFFLAGHETTSNSLSFAIYNLAKDKKIQEKARQEAITVLGDEPKDVFPTLDNCKKFTYIDMIVKEGLRLLPPANDLLPRVPTNDTNLGGVMIPKDSLVSVDIHALHHNPHVWKNPKEFIPERFEEGGEHSKHKGLTYMPFGSGSRTCIGVNFSTMEQRVALSMLLRKYEWELPEDSIHQNELVVPNIFNQVPKSLKIEFTKRY
ncbi:hypothetical protein INT45_001301, partial [Circinella minor]